MSDARNRLHPFLRPGEQLRWVGQPDPQVRFAPMDLFLVPFSLMWGGFAIVWEWQVLTSSESLLFVLWGIPFVLVGLYFIVGRFIYKKHRKLKTVYGLTDSRAIVSTSERSFDDTPIKNVPVRINRSRDNRHATIIFGAGGRQAAYLNTGMDFFAFGQAQGMGFFDVADPEALIRELDQVR
ncbi:hypothetical protein [Kocuria rosea]|uniref:hypothetical protein n=1 Tax=Kocuria rosea TaxID=1275 RepID=UPI002331341C|nr:hypothetical protein [Kocuria rosea]